MFANENSQHFMFDTESCSMLDIDEDIFNFTYLLKKELKKNNIKAVVVGVIKK